MLTLSFLLIIAIYSISLIKREKYTLSRSTQLRNLESSDDKIALDIKNFDFAISIRDFFIRTSNGNDNDILEYYSLSIYQMSYYFDGKNFSLNAE